MKSHPNWLNEKYHKIFDWFLNLGSHEINLINYFFDNELKFHKAYMINSLHVRSDFLYKKSLVSFDLVNTGLGIWKRVVSLFLKKVEFFLKFHLL